MEKRSYCGLNCASCDAYKATVNNDEALKAATAETWAKMYNAPISAADINCDGCKSEGEKFAHCTQCEIRACNIKKNLSSCAECSEYPCEHESFVINNSADAKSFIEDLRK